MIGNNIRLNRKRLGFIQQFGEMLDGNKSLISGYENRHSTLDIYILIKIADIFCISLDELVDREFKY